MGVDHHHWLLREGETVLVINLADLMWRPWRTRERIQNFMPCLGELDVDYVPKLGDDLVIGNLWKADGSARAFGETIDPSSFYDVESQTCYNSDVLTQHLKQLP